MNIEASNHVRTMHLASSIVDHVLKGMVEHAHCSSEGVRIHRVTEYSRSRFIAKGDKHMLLTNDFHFRFNNAHLPNLSFLSIVLDILTKSPPRRFELESLELMSIKILKMGQHQLNSMLIGLYASITTNGSFRLNKNYSHTINVVHAREDN